MGRSSARCALLIAVLLVGQTFAQSATNARFGVLDAKRLEAAAREPDQWFTGGRDASGTYYSPLAQINAGNVGRLGFAWDYAVGTTRGLEATPIVIDGVLFTSSSWGRVHALDARSGKELWKYLPVLDGQWARYACCDVVNRGVAVWRGKVYVGTLDGWLHALDARTGTLLWKVDTLSQRDRERHAHYTITGAPQIAGELVVIGNGGADFGVRGYVSAYNLDSGALAWRFYTVPHDPKLGPQEAPHLERAVGTWDPNSAWQYGGGGTVWDGMAYDANADLLYIGTGNGSPYNWKVRSPRGGDNLYLVSIIAIHAKTGRMAWYYQQVPGERWDYTATAKMILADIPISGPRGTQVRKVLMQAPKNGYFYVLDRLTGELISVNNYASVNWANGIDPRTHRPVINEALDYTQQPSLITPGMAGGHNWPPMSFSPKTGLIYIPVLEMPMVYVDISQRRLSALEGSFSTLATPVEFYDPTALALFSPLPSLDKVAGYTPALSRTRSMLRAWDPVNQRLAWETTTVTSFGTGSGVITTAGNLVLQGDGAGQLNIYAADSGLLLKRIETGSSIMAAPMSYAVGGVQYVAVMAGIGGGGGAFAPGTAAYEYGNAGRLIVFKLDGGAVPKPVPITQTPFPQPPPRVGGKATIADGEALYLRHCSACHAFGRGLMPDLRRSSPATHEIFREIVLGGAYVALGMGRFDDVLTPAQTDAIHAYVIDQAWDAYTREQSATP